MGSRSASGMFFRTGAVLAGAATASAAAAAPGTSLCPATIAEARSFLERQGRLPGGGEAYPRRYRTDGLSVLGGTPTALYEIREPGVLWSFTYELPVSYTISFRRNFEASPPPGEFAYSCPANSQCRWQVSGFGSAGPQPNHVVGSLLEADLRGSYSNPGAYSLACVYLSRRPAPR